MPETPLIEYGIQLHQDHYCIYERVKSPVGPWIESECPNSGHFITHRVECHTNCTSTCPKLVLIDKGTSRVARFLCGCELREEDLIAIP